MWWLPARWRQAVAWLRARGAGLVNWLNRRLDLALSSFGRMPDTRSAKVALLSSCVAAIGVLVAALALSVAVFNASLAVSAAGREVIDSRARARIATLEIANAEMRTQIADLRHELDVSRSQATPAPAP
jgi:hypothetical protein